MKPSLSAIEVRLFQTLRQPDVNPADEAEALGALQNAAPERWTIEALADALNQSPNYVGLALQLLDLPDVVLEDLREGSLTRDHAFELLRLPTDKLRGKV